jgi:hypothetical protein
LPLWLHFLFKASQCASDLKPTGSFKGKRISTVAFSASFPVVSLMHL